MTFDGNDCANADWKAGAPRPIAAAPVKNARLSTVFPLGLLLAGSQSPGWFSTFQPDGEAIWRHHSRIILLLDHPMPFWNEISDALE
jgi:hypothetical protein